MRKKLLTFIAIALCCIGSISADTSGSCGANLTWNLANGVLTISGTGKMNDYSTHGPWYRQGTINQVVIEDGVTYIGIHAFDDCSSITSVALGNSVDSIGWGAFFDCTNLSSINFPNSIKNIASYAFFSCKNLTSITIPSSVTNIGNRAFYDCPSLTTINVANDNPIYCSVDGVLFNKNRTTLILYPSAKSGSYAIPDGVTRIEKSAFFNCTNLTSVTIPNSVKIIEDQAFASSDFTSLIIGNGITYFGTEAFQYCTSLTSVILVNGLKSIGDYAFQYCSSLTSVTIPNSVTSIGGGAFEYCSSLTSVTISNSVTSIESYTFYECSSLTSVTIPNSVTSIGDYAFVSCSSLTSVTIPNSVTSIGEHAFQRCSSLTSVTIPNSVTSIGELAFNRCSSLTSVNITDIASWCNISFQDPFANPLYYGHNLYLNGTLVTDLVIPDGVTSVGEYAFYGCSSLTSVTIPNSVTSIGEGAFESCSSLTTINVANDNPDYCSIDGVLFNKAQTILILYPAGKADDTYSIPNSVTSIVEGAFSGSSSLTSLTCLAETPPQVDYTIFYYLDPSKIVLYVPAGSIELYRADEQWNKFIDIRPLSFTVTFKDWDGTVLKTEKLEQGADATAPADPVREGYTFVGWDAGFTNVQSDMTVTAIYSKPLTGRFSVSADKQVIFAQGNLQYRAAQGKWAFSDKQYDMIGAGNANTSSSYNGWIDLFGWGTAANPTETSKESAPYASFTDWTTKTIMNAANKTWYTMPEDEWNYLLSTRADAASKQGQAVVNEVKGYILLPDNWTLPAGLTFTATPYNYTTNVYTASEWEKLEAAGAVFLPAAGFRYGIDINGLPAGNGYYWTPTPSFQYDDMAQALMISEYSKAKVIAAMPCNGYSVRPVREVQASEAIDNIDASATFGGSRKLLRNGVLLIERNGKTYNAQGAEVR